MSTASGAWPERRRKGGRHSLAATLVLLASANAPLSGQDDETCATAGALTLERAVECVLATHPAVAAGRLEVQRAEVDLLRARALRRPDLRLNLETGLVPEARGDAVSSSDQSDDLDGLGPFYRLSLNAVYPLATFGKLEALRRTAERGIEVRRGGSEAAVGQLALETVRAFWGLQAARRSLDLAEDLASGYAELLGEVEAAVDDPDSEVDHTDLLEVRSAEYEIVLAAARARNGLSIASTGLSLLLGEELDENLELEPPDDPELPDAVALEEGMVALALRSNPSVRQLRAGLGVLEAQLALAEAAGRPDLFAAGSLGYAEASNRTDQTNPFVVDDFNFRTVAAFIGLRWNLNFKSHALEAEQKRLQREETRHKLDVAEQRLTLETVRALAAAVEHHELLQAAERSRSAARNWVRVSGENWELGLGTADKLIDAYSAFYRLGNLVLSKTAEFHVSLAGLAVASGDIGRYLDWIRTGEITAP